MNAPGDMVFLFAFALLAGVGAHHVSAWACQRAIRAWRWWRIKRGMAATVRRIQRQRTTGN